MNNTGHKGVSVFQLRRLMMTLVAGLLVTQLSVAQPPATPSRSGDYAVKYREVQQAILLARQNKFDEAEKVLRAASRKHKELPPVGIMMARLYLAGNENTKAEAALEAVVIEAPDDPEAFVLFGDLALRVGRLAYATLAYAHADQLLSDYASNAERKKNLQIRILAGLASTAERQKQYGKAAEHLEAWLKLSPDEALVLGSLGRVQFHAGQTDSARSTFTLLSQSKKSAPPPEIALARLFSDAGRQGEAIEEIETAVEKYPDDPRVVLTAAEWAINNGRIDNAEAYVAKALSLDEDSVPGRVLAARLARYRGELESARAMLQELVVMHPDSSALLDEFSRILIASDSTEDRSTGLKYAERNFRALQKSKTPEKLQALITLAWAHHRNGNARRALALAEALPDGSSISNENGYYVAAIYAGGERRDLATGMLKALLASDTEFPMQQQSQELLTELSGK